MVSLIVWIAALVVLFVKNKLIKQYFETLPGYNVNDSDANGIVDDFKELFEDGTTFLLLTVIWLVQFFCLNSDVVFIATCGGVVFLEVVCFVLEICRMNKYYYKKLPRFSQKISFKVLKKTYPLLKDKFLFLKNETLLCARHEINYAHFDYYKTYPAGVIFYAVNSKKREVVGFNFFDWIRAWMYFLNQERNEEMRKRTVEKEKLDCSTVITGQMLKDIHQKQKEIETELAKGEDFIRQKLKEHAGSICAQTDQKLKKISKGDN